jgi:hypothetical protein
MRIHLAALVALSGFFSGPAEAAPPAAERALRARVTQFNQLRVERKFRQSEGFVAEESKDFYYESKKADLKAFRIDKIEFAPDLKTAVVTIHGKAEVMIPPGVPVVSESSYTDHWKLENGKWCWYLDKSQPLEGPFGRSAPHVFDGSAPPDPTIAKALSTAASMGSNGAVQADRQQIALDASHPKSEVITLKNILPGQVTLKLVTESPALKVSIAKPGLGPAESTEVTVTPVEGSRDRPAALVFSAQPLNQRISIAITWVAGQ